MHRYYAVVEESKKFGKPTTYHIHHNKEDAIAKAKSLRVDTVLIYLDRPNITRCPNGHGRFRVDLEG